jgi:pectinesterase
MRYLCREKVVVNKAGVSLVGRSATSTIVTWSGPWNQNHQSEFALYVQATDFVAKGLTFQVLLNHNILVRQ